MTPALGQFLPLLAPLLTTSAAAAALSARARWLPGSLLALALVADLALSVSALAVNAALGGAESMLFTWSPLGLYGVSVFVRRAANVALLTCPALFLALLGVALAERRRRWFSGRGSESLAARAAIGAALLALSGGIWAARAADFVSLFFGVSLYLLAGALVLAFASGMGTAARRTVANYVTLAALLTAGLLLGKVNGHFQLAGLSSAGFTDVAFFGLAIGAASLASIPPFHGWLLRCSRGALAPALAAAGLASGTSLLLTAFLATDPSVSWQGQLRALGWIAALLGSAVAVARRRAAISLAAAWVARTGALFLAASVGTPASLASAAAFAAVSMTAHGALWLTASTPWGGHVRARVTPPPPLTVPGFWVNLLLLASAVGLPPTLGGTVRALLTGTLTSWPSGDQLLRVPLILSDIATLLAGSALLWEARYLPPLHGRRGWAAAGTLAAVLILPALVPQALLSPWLDPATATLVGTSISPLRLTGPVLPHMPSVVLAVVSAWALFRRLRGREWLPTPALALLGVLAIGWTEGRRRWRRRGLGAAPAVGGRVAWQRAQGVAERVLVLLRPFEERYYAGTAILLAVAIIFVLGR